MFKSKAEAETRTLCELQTCSWESVKTLVPIREKGARKLTVLWFYLLLVSQQQWVLDVTQSMRYMYAGHILKSRSELHF